MWAAQGVLTSTGGMTSHAAVVARGWGKCCICGAGDLIIDYKKRTVTVGRKVLKQGDSISLNGSTGNVYLGEIPTEVSPVVAAVVDGKKAQKLTLFIKCMQRSLNGLIQIEKLMFVQMQIHQKIPLQLRHLALKV